MKLSDESPMVIKHSDAFQFFSSCSFMTLIISAIFHKILWRCKMLIKRISNKTDAGPEQTDSSTTRCSIRNNFRCSPSPTDVRISPVAVIKLSQSLSGCSSHFNIDYWNSSRISNNIAGPFRDSEKKFDVLWRLNSLTLFDAWFNET